MLYDLAAARTPEQRRRMQSLEEAGVCVFCLGQDSASHPTEVVISGEHWYVRQNEFPYRGTRGHWLLVPYRHVSSFDELPDDAGRELWSLRRQLKELVPGPAAATVERSGDMRYNGGSIAHLHVHFVVPDESPNATVRFKLSRTAYVAGA